MDTYTLTMTGNLIRRAGGGEPSEHVLAIEIRDADNVLLLTEHLTWTDMDTSDIDLALNGRGWTLTDTEWATEYSGLPIEHLDRATGNVVRWVQRFTTTATVVPLVTIPLHLR